MPIIQPNSRQIPKITEICGNKKYDDKIYSYLQFISSAEIQDGKIISRFIPFEHLNFSKMAERLKISRPTVKKYFDYLQDIGLIEKNTEEKKYTLLLIDNEKAFLIPLSTLEALLKIFEKKVISIYIYLFKRWIAAKEQPFDFTQKQIKSFLQLNTDNYHCNIVTLALDALQGINILSYSPIVERQANGTILNKYQLNWIKNTLDKKYINTNTNELIPIEEKVEKFTF